MQGYVAAAPVLAAWTKPPTARIMCIDQLSTPLGVVITTTTMWWRKAFDLFIYLFIFNTDTMYSITVGWLQIMSPFHRWLCSANVLPREGNTFSSSWADRRSNRLLVCLLGPEAKQEVSRRRAQTWAGRRPHSQQGKEEVHLLCQDDDDDDEWGFISAGNDDDKET